MGTIGRLPSASRPGPRRLRKAERGIEELRRIGPEGWVYVGDWPGDPFTTSVSPPYENGWAWAGAPYARVAFRWGLDGSLEFQGHLDSAGASSGTVAFTLPPEYLPAADLSWPTDVWDGAAFTLARVAIDSTTGEVTIVFPAT